MPRGEIGTLLRMRGSLPSESFTPVSQQGSLTRGPFQVVRGQVDGSRMQSIGDKARFGKKAKSSQAPLASGSSVVSATVLDTMTPGKKRKLCDGKSIATLLSSCDSGSASGTGDSQSMDVKTMPSAPNGEPMAKRKRTRLSQGPQAMMGSLRVAGRSMMNLLDGQGEAVGAETPGRRKGM